jgi:phosphate starvation-inducible protein PhoH
VVRHPLVQKIVKAYDRYERTQAKQAEDKQGGR